jgi:glutathione S-transferase
VLGLSGEIKVEAADTNDDKDSLRQQNPVGKIPVLVLEDGSTLFDSRVILEYLDHRAGGGKIIPKEPAARFAALRLQALADGATDAQILVLYEGRWRSPEHHVAKWLDYQNGKIIPKEPAARFAALRLQALADGATDAQILVLYEGRWRSPEHHAAKWLDYQNDKIARALAALEASPPSLDATPNVGQIAVACFLGHRDLRFAGDWRAKHPKLVAWLDRFAAQVPAFASTKVAA